MAFRLCCRTLIPRLFRSTSAPLPPALQLLHRMTTSSSLSPAGPEAKPGARRRSEPRTYPSQGFDVIDRDRLVEEEGLPGYSPRRFYPVRLGEVFNDRFQIVTKLGYGTSSTIWLARDLEDDQYVALKIYIHDASCHGELPFYERLGKVMPSQHWGAGNVRQLSDSFEVVGPEGTHTALVLQISQMSLRDMDTVLTKGRGFDEGFVQAAIFELLEAVDFLHTEVQAVHTDIHPGNLLLGLYDSDNSLFKVLEDEECSKPSPRKELPDRTICFSSLMKPKVGPLLLSEFGEARLGPGPHAGDIMPLVYRAPETLLRIQWGYPVDIWSVGLTAWDLLEGRPLFSAWKKERRFSDRTAVHLSELIAALGPPPAELLDRNRKRARKYWGEDGRWCGFVPIPAEKTLGAAETKLQDKTGLRPCC